MFWVYILYPDLQLIFDFNLLLVKFLLVDLLMLFVLLFVSAIPAKRGGEPLQWQTAAAEKDGGRDGRRTGAR